MTGREAVERHRSLGWPFNAAGIRSFVRDEGAGEPVVCMHGVPVSCFLYRKMLPELAARGLRGVAFDLPGLGFADRRPALDYTWTGLGRFARAAVDSLGLHRFHLVVHDVGGPVGFELAAATPERVLSLTVLNTLIEVDTFKRPWSMEPFAIRGVRFVWLWSLTRASWRAFFHLQGIKNHRAVPRSEIDAHLELLRRVDGGRSFLRIMRGFERTPEKRELYASALEGPYPVQVVWGEHDPTLLVKVQGEQARRAAGLDEIHTLPAKHFLPEDQAPAIAERVAALAASAGRD
ncbi:MAG: alpha/beta fold hydrolase [Actinomycetota bacterium]|nr:alpha/beta fold hydrolase [Actinomycetota bacterium]MDQ3648365.1 alpha/beta fold hydrolase [Actinomycetota bacterium]